MAGKRKEESRPEKPEEASSALAEVLPPYNVILHDDNQTPMDFVVETLVRFFIPDRSHAVEVMHAAHQNGMALVAVMALERAEFKVEQAHGHARSHGFPLTFTIEPGGK